MQDPTVEGSGVEVSRRGFLAAAGSATGALVVAFHLPTTASAATKSAKSFAPNAYVRVGTDDRVTIVMALVEMGQGTFTSVPMLIAEELEVDLSQVTLEQAPADEKTYGHPVYGLQVTGGSGSIPGAWKALRGAGATAKHMLVAAAAQAWKVPESECRAEKGTVKHTPSGRSLRYGALAERAAKLPVPKDVALKDPANFRLVGTNVPRLDTPSKVNGTARFGIDVQQPGMKVAAIAICPVVGGRFGSMDDSKARAVKGVRAVLSSDTAVAVVADHYGAAKKGLAALTVKWDEGANASFSSKVWGEQLEAALKTKGMVATNDGNFERAHAAAQRKISAVYEAPPLAHATMEPLNCTIHVRKDTCDVWLGTQAPARVQSMVAEVLGRPATSVTVHNFLLGGGFGRKLEGDYVAEAAKLAKQVSYPLKVVWSREEDLQHDAYRPYFRDEVSAALGPQGEMVAFSHRVAGSAVLLRYAPVWFPNGLDNDAVDLAGSSYDVPNKYVEYVRHEPPNGLLTGNWRGVGPTHNVFVVESFVDEIAALSKADPLAFRERHLGKNPRGLAVLRLAAQRAGWGSALPKGKGRGICLAETFGGYAALVTELSVANDGNVTVDRMVCAVDVGRVVHPDGVEAQVQGGLLFGLTAVLFGTITFEGGRVIQTNFHDYQPLRINQAPKIEVHTIKSNESPVGVGEIGTAVVAASVINAIHSATGKRLRTYPISADSLKS